MNRVPRAFVSFCAVGALALATLFFTATVARPGAAQDGGKRGQANAKREAREQERAAAAAAKAKEHAARLADFVKFFPQAKVTLAAAVETAEKQTKGRAYDVAFHLDADGRLALSVGIVADERFYLVPIDPMSGEASAAIEEPEPDPDLGLPDDDEE